MASNKRLFIKVLLFLVGSTCLMVFGFFFFLYKVIDNSMGESKRVAALPEVSSLLCAENNMIAPISGDSVAFFLLEYKATHRSSSTSSSYSTTNRDVFSQGIQLCLESGAMPVEFTTLPQTVFYNAKNKKPHDNFQVAISLAFKGEPDLPPHLLGVNSSLDCIIAKAYKSNYNRDIGVYLGCSTGDYSSVEIKEYTWRKGDSLTVKGEIVDGELKLLW